jgi:hypothetical protein
MSAPSSPRIRLLEVLELAEADFAQIGVRYDFAAFDHLAADLEIAGADVDFDLAHPAGSM